MARVRANSVSAVLRSLAKAVLTLPLSPPVFAAGVFALRRLHVLPKETAKAAGPVKRIFVSHPYSSIGDLVLLIPLLERIREEWPDAIVDVAVGEPVADLLSGVPGLNRIIRHPPDPAGIPYLRDYPRAFRLLRSYRRHMAHADYDLAIAPRWGAIDTWPAFYLAYLTAASRRVGYSALAGNRGGDTRLDALLTDVAVGGANEHETARNLKLLSRAGLSKDRTQDNFAVNETIPSVVALSVRLRASGRPQGSESAVPAEPYAVISPGATAAFRIWPATLMAAAIRTLRQQTGLQLLIVGSRSDSRLCDQLVKLSPDGCTAVAGKTDILDLLALLAGARFFLGMDSGTAHLAGALGIPTVVLSPFPAPCNLDHPNSPRRFRPCGPNVRVLQPEHPLPPCDPTCSFLEPHCIRQISSEAVSSAVLSALATGGRNAPSTALQESS